MKKILMITTGGTIACRRTEAGLTPVLGSDELLKYVPVVRDMCFVDTESLMNKDSTEMLPRDWLTISVCIKKNYDVYDGFVICHGTDTMAYTSAALSYLIQRSPKPIIVTGSQRPIDMEITDARQNLIDSFQYACFPRAHGVSIVFDGEVIAGTRAKKTHTKSYNAFSSVNYPLIAAIKDSRVVQYIEQSRDSEPLFFDRLDHRVKLIKLVPGSDSDALDFLLSSNNAVIIESFGTGGLPESFYGSIERGIRNGKVIVMTTQVPNEGSDMTVYKVGRAIKERFSLLEAFDMTLEASLTKLMWALGQTGDCGEIRRLFYTPVGADILFTD